MAVFGNDPETGIVRRYAPMLTRALTNRSLRHMSPRAPVGSENMLRLASCPAVN